MLRREHLLGAQHVLEERVVPYRYARVPVGQGTGILGIRRQWVSDFNAESIRLHS